jgi:hypothetical protein
MAGNYSLPLTSEVDADSPLNESLFNTRIRGTLLGLGYANSVFGTFAGNGADTDTGPTETGNLDCGAAGKQYTSWTIPAGVTITLTASGGVHRIGVTGTLTIEGTLTATGHGGAGGAGSTGTYGDGSPGISCGKSGNGSANGGRGGSGNTYTSYGFGLGGKSYSDGLGTGEDYARSSDYDRFYGSGEGHTGETGAAASTGVIGLWYANPCMLGPGAGGGGGGNGRYSAGHGGDGGAGGGLIIIECDTFVFSAGAIISADGAQGAQAVNTGSPGGNGGSGGGGTIVVYCRVLTSNAGSFSVAGGTAMSGIGTTGGGGGAGRYAVVVLGEQATAGTA